MDKTTSYFLRVLEDAKHYSDERERRLNFIIGAYEDRILCLQAENERLRGLLHEARENVDLDVRELETMYHGYPEIIENKTAADRDLRNRIDAALAAGGE